MTTSPDFRAGRPDDLAGVRALLDRAGLPFDDLAASGMENFIVLRNAAGELLAAGGIEVYGGDALLRSVVVGRAVRGTGIGRMTVHALEQRARTLGVTDLYLLTTTAADFFPRLGYRIVERAAAPASVARSAEFASLCPATAVCMRKCLE